MKSQLQRSISDLEQTIKHKVLSHQNHYSDAWIRFIYYKAKNLCPFIAIAVS
ncbi:hypothetical protein [Alicyclobacillus dauci]|uniref:Uncharacterized protein n=1 Tax=Alicyclobacillus dauci TaxID=1475485 RepID=A0ABY6Z7L3_9BACL|nr:hypothetical protein [Alicyclobacillus dauci]WAH38877.1 hypothetical protein NZD86_10555 [Alicyclobacillus dauci]